MKTPGKNPVVDVTPKAGVQKVYFFPAVRYLDIHNATGAPENMSVEKPRFRALVESIEREGLRIPVFGIIVGMEGAIVFRSMTGKQRVEALHYLGRDVPFVAHDVHHKFNLLPQGYRDMAVQIHTEEEGQRYFEGEAKFSMGDRYVSVVKHRNWRDEVG